MKCLILGTPGDVRVKGFQDALHAFGHPPAEVISYPDWLAIKPEARTARLNAVDRVRIESPGRDPETTQAICRLANFQMDQPIDSVRDNSPLQTTQLGHGFIELLHRTGLFESANPQTCFLNAPWHISLVNDKTLTTGLLHMYDIPVPRLLARNDACEGYNQVRESMAQAGISRAFIKLSYGFSGSGVVAYQFSNQNRELAITTVAMEQTTNGTRLYNTRKLQRYTDPNQIGALFDALCPLGVYVEQWIPKAGVNNRTTDLRVVTIAGEVRHIVLRMSRSPITNLHLLNERSDPYPLKDAMRPDDWDELIDTCKKVARCFPKMLYLGIDIAVHADLRRHTVLEVNAFGDLLHGITDRGQNTYEAEVEAMADWSGSLD